MIELLQDFRPNRERSVNSLSECLERTSSYTKASHHKKVWCDNQLNKGISEHIFKQPCSSVKSQPKNVELKKYNKYTDSLIYCWNIGLFSLLIYHRHLEIFKQTGLTSCCDCVFVSVFQELLYPCRQSFLNRPLIPMDWHRVFASTQLSLSLMTLDLPTPQAKKTPWHTAGIHSRCCESHSHLSRSPGYHLY